MVTIGWRCESGIKFLSGVGTLRHRPHLPIRRLCPGPFPPRILIPSPLLPPVHGLAPFNTTVMPPPPHGGDHDKPLRAALDPISTPAFPSLQGSLSIAKEVLMGFQSSDYRRSESVRILSDRKRYIVTASASA
jgi:hypothetical protein